VLRLRRQNAALLVSELTGHIWNTPAISVVAAVSDSESGESGGGGRELPASGGHQVKADFIVKALITISKATTYDEDGAKDLVEFSLTKLILNCSAVREYSVQLTSSLRWLVL